MFRPGAVLMPGYADRMSDMPNSLPATGSSLSFPLDGGDEFAGSWINELADGGDSVTVGLQDGRRVRYRLDMFPGGGGRWVLER